MPVYKNEEKNTWYASFYYTDWTGQRKRKKKEGFALKRDALEFERKFKLQQSGSCEMSFAEMAELYLTDCKTRQKPTSYHVKENGIQKHILPYFKDFPVNAITVGQVRQWQNTLLDSGKYSQNYLHTINGYLSAIFNHAVKFYGLQSNPSKECGKIKETRPQLHFWTKEEFDTFMEQLGEVYPARTMFLLLFWTGMRSGEMLALTLNDFDFEKHTVKISKTYARFQKADLVQTPKTQKSNRLISIPPFLEEEIKAHVQRLYGYSPEERLFSLTSHYLLYYIEKISLQEGLPKIRLHDLRHSHASMLIHMGVSPLLIQERLGHENIETTLNTYSHLYPNQQGELAVKLDTLYKNGTISVR